MGVRALVNSGLTKSTGYQVTKAAGVSSLKKELQDLKARDRDRERVLAELESSVARLKQERAARNAPSHPVDFDDAAVSIIDRVRPWTMTSPDKLFALISAVRYVAHHAIPGDIVECGVWRGGSMQAAALALLEQGDISRDLYLFDTFEGMTEPTERDVRHDGLSAAEMLRTQDTTSRVWAVASLEDVQDGFSQIGYPSERTHFIPGRVEETIPERAPDVISILRLDTDWYESTRHELESLYPRLVSGGVLIIDDYGWWRGSREATDEFLEITGEKLLLMRAGGGRIAVKP